MLKYVFLCLWWLCDSHWMEVRGRWKLEKANSAYYNPTTPCHPSNTSQPHWDRNKKEAFLLMKSFWKFVSRTGICGIGTHLFLLSFRLISMSSSSFLFRLCVSNQAYLTSFTKGPKGITITKYVWERRPRQEFQTSLFQHFTPAAISNKWPLPSINPVSLHSRAHQGSNWKIEQGREHQLPKPDCK